MKKQKFEYHLTVPAIAIDMLGHVNNVVYLEWVQTAASKHWEQATANYFKDIPKNEMVWVVKDHYITYKSEAFQNDEVIVTTFVEKFTAVTSERHTIIRRKDDDKILASAITNWCLLKMPEGKPMRVPEEIIALF
ncbi:acyl-CoA thioesterase [Dokdonia sp. Hel_I_53]|uniref:acyl-CoA thioesterase n=1 Tax=Dokdonia sp. Hel_I_53 TaxID=1566287 RepID=UPI001199A57D|nr:thioesterase family protein [Dokdonia sp. Hel_I_53]TVZ52495.1 acyl-CoA thioester hydrolase [Dokdonia sp. Hel_I_53]